MFEYITDRRWMEGDFYRHSPKEREYLNEMGKLSWELVSVVSEDDGQYSIYYFKRKII